MFLDKRLTRRAGDPSSDHEPNAQLASEHCWYLEFAFRNEELCDRAPVGEIIDALCRCGLPETARPDVFTVMNELYLNALDYGVLRMTRPTMEEEGDFYKFHQQRDAKLECLRGQSEARAWIKIDCRLDIADRPSLELTVADSGPGLSDCAFDTDASGERTYLHGRGLKIVSSLVDDIRFFGRRNQVKIQYRC